MNPFRNMTKDEIIEEIKRLLSTAKTEYELDLPIFALFDFVYLDVLTPEEGVDIMANTKLTEEGQAILDKYDDEYYDTIGKKKPKRYENRRR